MQELGVFFSAGVGSCFPLPGPLPAHEGPRIPLESTVFGRLPRLPICCVHAVLFLPFPIPSPRPHVGVFTQQHSPGPETHTHSQSRRERRRRQSEGSTRPQDRDSEGGLTRVDRNIDRKTQPRPQERVLHPAGALVEVTVRAPLEDFYKGGTVRANVRRRVVCRGCRGHEAHPRCSGCSRSCPAETKVVQRRMGPMLINEEVQVPSEQLCREEVKTLHAVIERGAEGDAAAIRLPLSPPISPISRHLGAEEDTAVTFERSSEQSPGEVQSRGGIARDRGAPGEAPAQNARLVALSALHGGCMARCHWRPHCRRIERVSGEGFSGGPLGRDDPR